MFGRTEFRFCQKWLLSENPWQSRNSVPPVLSIKELVEKERSVICLLSKQFATDVWEDRIPILSKVIVIRESLTKSELCPSGPCVKKIWLKRNNGVLHFISKQFATDVWEDRIPILSKVIVIRESLTESEFCPPDLALKRLIEKKQWSTSFYKQTVCN